MAPLGRGVLVAAMLPGVTGTAAPVCSTASQAGHTSVAPTQKQVPHMAPEQPLLQELAGIPATSPYPYGYGASVPGKASAGVERFWRCLTGRAKGGNPAWGSFQEPYPKGVIPLSVIEMARSTKDNKFQVFTSHRIFVFRAENEGK